MPSVCIIRDVVTALPTLPQTLVRLLQLIDDPAASSAALAALLRTDPPLSASLLRLANSVYYRRPGAVRTVQEAVTVLGRRTVRHLVLGTTVISRLAAECGRRRLVVDYRALLAHGAATGAVARDLAIAAGHGDPELAYTGGLLHDLGKFVLVLHEPRAYAEVLAGRPDDPRPLRARETACFGFDHAEAGAEVAAYWGFPADLVGCCARHHDPVATADALGFAALANAVVHWLAGARSDVTDDLVDACEVLGLDPQGLAAGSNRLRAEIGVLSL